MSLEFLPAPPSPYSFAFRTHFLINLIAWLFHNPIPARTTLTVIFTPAVLRARTATNELSCELIALSLILNIANDHLELHGLQKTSPPIESSNSPLTLHSAHELQHTHHIEVQI